MLHIYEMASEIIPNVLAPERLDRMTPDEMGEALRLLSNHYYNGDPLVPDAVFDRLRDTLASRSPKHPSLREIGAPVHSHRNKAPLPFAMGSLEKWKAEDPGLGTRLNRWMRAYPGPYTVSSKLDGTSGMLVASPLGDHEWELRLYTRGDGKVGVDIGHLLPFLVNKTFQEALSKAPRTSIAVRGELLLSRHVFAQKYSDDMARPRAVVNGLVNRKEIQKKEAKDIDFIVYEVVEPRLAKSAQMELLQSLGLRRVPFRRLETLTPEALQLELSRQKTGTYYDMDGLVVEAEGPFARTSDRTPDYALAYKMADEAQETRVVKVHWKASKGGLWKPTIEYEPVKVAGTVLRNATGFHAQSIRDRGIGPGARVTVGLGGDVIPQVIDVLASVAPDFPPSADYEWDAAGVEIRMTEAAKIRETGYLRAQLLHFVKKLKIPHLSEETLEKFLQGGVDSLPKVLRVTKKELETLPGIGPKSAERLIEGIRGRTKDVPLELLMAASNCWGNGFAEKKLKIILQAFPNILTQPPEVADLCQVKSIENKTAVRFLEGLEVFQGWLVSVPEITWTFAAAAPEEVQGPWTGKVVVFTGFRSEALATRLGALGATLAENISSKTTVLVTKTSDTSSAKAKKAADVGARVVDRASLERELGM